MIMERWVYSWRKNTCFVLFLPHFHVLLVTEASDHTLPFKQPQIVEKPQCLYHCGAFVVCGGCLYSRLCPLHFHITCHMILVQTYTIFPDFFVCLAFTSPRNSLGWELGTHTETHRYTFPYTKTHRHTDTNTYTRVSLGCIMAELIHGLLVCSWLKANYSLNEYL